LKEHGSRAVRQWIDELVAQDILSRSGEYSVIGLTSRGLDLLRGDAGDVVLSVAVPAARRTSKKPLPAPSSVHPGLREHLRGVRRDLAEAEAVPPYIIVGDASLDSMAALRPITAAQF